MINHIDVSVALRRSVAHLYSDLVTRPTGAAVRQEIEQQLERVRDRTLTVIDFSHVGLLDFSCADEVVAKLLLRYCAGAPPHDGYFVFRGVREVHLDAIEAVLERHRLALIVQTEDGLVRLIGEVSDAERAAWAQLDAAGRCSAAELSAALGLAAGDAEVVLDALCRRRLAMSVEQGFIAVGGTLLAGRLQ